MTSPHFLHLIAFLIILGIIIPSLAHLIFSTGVCTETRQWDSVLLQNRVFSRSASSTYSRIYEIHRLLQSSAHTLLIRSQVSSKLVPSRFQDSLVFWIIWTQTILQHLLFLRRKPSRFHAILSSKRGFGFDQAPVKLAAIL